MYYLIFGLLTLALICYICLDRFYLKQSEKRTNITKKVVKILTISFVVLSFVDIFMPDAFSTRLLNQQEYLKETHNPFHTILRLINHCAMIVIPFTVLYKKPTLTKVVAFIIIPGTILNYAFNFQYINYFITATEFPFGPKTVNLLTNVVFRSVWFGLIQLIQLGLSVFAVINNLDHLKFHNKKEITDFIMAVPALLISNMPIHFFQQLLGTYESPTFNMGDPMHIIWIFAMAVEAVLLVLVFKKRSYEDKYILLFIMALSLLFQYNSFFRTDGIITATRYPLQLCNIAGLFIIIMLLTKSEKMFHFTIVINVVGALIAIALCDSTANTGVLYCMNIHYIVEHTNVLLVPLLAIILGVFKPLKKKDFKDFVLGFSFYFLLVLVLGTIFNGIKAKSGNDYWSCNYLFMFQKEAATRLIGNFVGTFFDINLTIATCFHLYLVQIFVYVVFLAICTGIFFALYAIFKDRNQKQTQDATPQE